MSGKRILDALAVIKASRNVAAKHVALRRSQLDVYSKTSSLAHAVKSQTDRLTLTVKAASALSQRLNSTDSGYSSAATETNTDTGGSSVAPNQAKSSAQAEPVTGKQEAEQDHSHDNSQASTVAEQISSYARTSENASGGAFDKHRRPTDSPSAPGPDQARKLQRQAEKQIPSQAAEPPPTSEPNLQATTTNESNESGLTVGQDQDVFYEPPPKSGQVLSALPRMKIPKNAENTQESDGIVHDGRINQDVFYSSVPTEQGQIIPEAQAVPEQEQIPEETYSELFQSPKVASMLGGGSKKYSISKGLNLPSAMETPTKRTKAPQDKDQVSSSLRIPAEEPKFQQEPDKDPPKMTADMVKDVDRTPPITSQSPQDLNASSMKPPYKMRESRVPSSRFGRLWQYSGLATSMAFGAVGESFRRATGSQDGASGSLMLSAANMERLVAKLSRMRGAALKLGQMVSFQDSKMLPGPVNEVLQRVQDSADFMPPSQRNKVLASNLGSDWRKLFSFFDEKPMAAASIGQVHSGILASTGQKVAVKVQYPGVASSIDSDLSNLSVLLTASRLLPKGLYLDKTIANARTELAWECDYIREAEMGARFRELLADETDIFYVPAIIQEASGPQVLTAEYCEGIGVTKAQNFTQNQKDWIGTHILRLCLREITEFKLMQTDPNWTNFLFNSQSKKLELLDFGASREYPDKFILPYIKTLLAASHSDRASIRDFSIQLGYLTGHESQAMLNAHVDSVLTLAEPFMDTSADVYDFRDQTITNRVRSLIPVMVRERLAPPPEETYSLHRKLSGAFLLCARLGARVRCKELFANAMGRVGFV